MYLVNGRPGKNEYGDMSLERMNTINGYLRSRFNNKMIKLSLDGGFTCPNRDGSKGFGGCIFCSKGGSGEFSADKLLSVTEQIEQAKREYDNAILQRLELRKEMVELYDKLRAKSDSARVMQDKSVEKVRGEKENAIRNLENFFMPYLLFSDIHTCFSR